jgi:putative acetyltransferase
MNIRRYKVGEEERLWQIYHDTMHIINGRDYTAEQCERWAPAMPDMPKCIERTRAKNPFVAEEGGKMLGYAELENDGYIDRFYVAHDHQRQGVGRSLYEAIEQEAQRLAIPRLHARVSITAKDFFLRMGFRVVTEQRKVICGAVAPNFIMEKLLSA